MVHRSSSLTEYIDKCVELAGRGVICPAEAWRMIADALQHYSSDEEVVEMAEDSFESLERLYAERPWSFEWQLNEFPILEKIATHLANRMIPPEQ